jgi:endoglucanase
VKSSDALPAAALVYRGVNLNGAEFGVRDAFGRDVTLPGMFGVDYIYPGETELDYFTSRGMNTFRLAFRWERLQPVLGGAFDQMEWGRVEEFLRAAEVRGAKVILNPQNFARWRDQIIGSASVPVELFAGFWSRIAERCIACDHVIFGLMNEPHDLPTEQWLAAANAAIRAIRATGAQHLILVPGNGYSGAHSWCGGLYGTPNARVMTRLAAEAGPFAYEVHQYLDGDCSGTSPRAVSRRIGSVRLAQFTRWLRENGARGFLGEFASGADPVSLAALEDLLEHLHENQDVWLGWTYWAAGPWWGDYFFSIQPEQTVSGLTEKPQMAVLARYLTPPSPPAKG